MKNNILAIAALAILVCSCTSREQRFTVRGNITDSLAFQPGSIVYLISKEGPVDSCAVSPKGTFTFKGDQDKTRQLVTMLQFPGRDLYDERFLASFVPDAETITIDLDYPATVTGSPLTDAVNDFVEKVTELYYEHETNIGSLTMGGFYEAADSIIRVRTARINDLSRETFLAHTDDVLGMQAFMNLCSDMDIDQLEELLPQAADFIRENEEIQQILERKRAAAATAPGSMYIDITGTKADGTPVALSEFAGKGQYVLVDFWASWCGPCMQAIGNLRTYKEKYAGKGLRIVGVNVWESNPEKGITCAKEKEMDWDIIYTSDHTATENYGVEGIPTLILIAPDGKIAERFLGEEGLENALARLFE
ncbi:MAG: AhpC/TSA family protein [Bacteroidales bacterium]|nr:AhpC/TSA family protein [Bacteroidales bacterium]